MQSGKTFFNDKDLYLTWGAVVENGSYSGLLQPPAFKSIKWTDWHEYNGAEADLSQCYFNSRSFSISFVFLDKSNINTFIEYINTNTIGFWRFCDIIPNVIKLRVTEAKATMITKTFAKVSVSFSDDNYTIPYERNEDLIFNADTTEEVQISGKNLGIYGARLLQGSESIKYDLPKRKDPLVINESNHNGSVVFGEGALFKNYDVNLPILIQAQTVEEGVKKYCNLLHDCTAKNQSNIRLKFAPFSNSKELKAVYKNATISQCRINKNGALWLQFSLNFTIYGL